MIYLKYIGVLAFLSVGAMYFAVFDMLQGSGSREQSVLSMLTLATVIVAVLFALIVGFIHKQQQNVAYVLVIIYTLAAFSYAVHFNSEYDRELNTKKSEVRIKKRKVIKVPSLPDRQAVEDSEIAETDSASLLPMVAMDVECETLKTAIAEDNPGLIRVQIRKGIRIDCESKGKSALDILFTRKYKNQAGANSLESMISSIISMPDVHVKESTAIRAELESLIIDKYVSYLASDVNMEDIKRAIVQANYYLLKALVRKIPLTSRDIILNEKYHVTDIYNPLVFAILVGHPGSVEILLKAGADTRQKVQYAVTVNGQKQTRNQNMYEFAQSFIGVTKGPLGRADYRSVANVLAKYHVLSEDENKQIAEQQAQKVANEEAEKQRVYRKQAAEEEQRNQLWKQEIKSKYGNYSSPARQAFFISNSFVDDAEVANPSHLSCRTDLLRYFSGELMALRGQFQQDGSEATKWSSEDSALNEFLFGYEGCAEFDPRLTYWGLFVDGSSPSWRPIDLKDMLTLELSVISEPCGSGVVPIVKLSVAPNNAVLFVGVPSNKKLNKVLYQNLSTSISASQTAKTDTQIITLPVPRLGNIRKVTIEKHYAMWVSDEPPLSAQQVIDQATLFLELNSNGKTRRVQVFQDKGYGKYSYSNADIRGVHLIDADFDGDIDVLLTGSNNGYYLIIFDGDRPRRKPLELKRPEEPMVIGGC